MAPTHLVIVCCHGIWLGGPSKGFDESEWLIADFQRGETPTFIEHLEAGVRLASDEHSVLAVSGGPTRRETQTSEAQSYLNIALAQSLLPLAPVLVEDRALDTYHNILFSLTLFHTRFSTWPERISIVSHAFKRSRIQGHCVAIGYPLEKVTLVGIDPPGVDGGEGAAQAAEEWAMDPHGRGPELAAKRMRRNPWRVWQGVFERGSGNGGLAVRDEVLDEDAVRPWA